MTFRQLLLLMALTASIVFPARAAVWCPKPPVPAAARVLTHELATILDRPPRPIAHVHTEGTLPHQGLWDVSIAAQRDLPIMRNAALAWRSGGGDAYLTMAERYLQAWTSTYKPDLNPIDETTFDALIETYAIIKDRLAPAERIQDERFLRGWAEGYLDSMARATGSYPTSWTNNWQSHRVKLVTLLAAALDGPDLWMRARAAFERQLAQNVLPNGEVIDFRERDAAGYVVYDLEPLLAAALQARNRGEDWYGLRAPNGASLAKAVAWLAPFARGQRTHEEFVHSKVPFDAIRAAAGLKGHSGPFDPKSAGHLYWAASEVDPSYEPLAEKLMPNPPPEILLCGM